MCVQRSMTIGRNCGLITGLGAASAHGLFAAAALVGAQAISAHLAAWRQPLRLVSAAILIAPGIRAWLREPAGQDVPASISGHAAYSSTLVLALANPMTILPYAAVASGITLSAASVPPFSSWSVVGVMLGSIAWYAALSVGTAPFCRMLSTRAIRSLNYLAGTAFVAIGVFLLTR